MNNQPLVSIIIPTYNRAHLIGETLDSVLAQTYQNWECIIVDDGSTDNTDEVVGDYLQKDKRFKYYHRPYVHLPGGNGARNYGFKMSQGEYVNWFDSDDLMLPVKIEYNLRILKQYDTDFVIDEFVNFKDKPNNPDINLNTKEINVKDYIFHKEFWGTCNFCCKRDLLKDITFNEELKSGQDYNFFVKFILSRKDFNAIKITCPLILRRVHADSIQEKQKKHLSQRHENKFNIYWLTFNETKASMNKAEKAFFIKSFLGHYFSLVASHKMTIKPQEIVKATRTHFLQTTILYSIIKTYIITKLGYHKLRTLYIKFTL